jgi:hypothetical protein
VSLVAATSPSQPVHWSKDYVEHLRTVHLTLIAVSVGILIIATSIRPYNPAVAARELHQIIQLKHLWSPYWVRAHSEHNVVDTHPRPAASTSSHDYNWYEFGADEDGYHADVTRRSRTSPDEKFVLSFPRTTICRCRRLLLMACRRPYLILTSGGTR